MIELASRAKNGIKVATQKASRAGILEMLHAHLRDLRDRLTVSWPTLKLVLVSSMFAFQGPQVKGKISVTCDCWQASNVDSYFAVTAHWIEVHSDSQWSLEAGMIGFTRLNHGHTGQRLGQALFMLLARVGIAQKVRLYYFL
jgi:hypothetical protein